MLLEIPEKRAGGIQSSRTATPEYVAVVWRAGTERSSCGRRGLKGKDVR